MAHLLVLRFAKSFVQGDNIIYGVHEEIEKNIDKREYHVSSHRNGYAKANSCEGRFIFYRVKKDIIGDFARDLGGRVLNPYPNNMTLWKVLFGGLKKNERASVGRMFKVIQYIFKWLNRFPFKYLHPIKPVPVNYEKAPEKFSRTWHHHYIFGMLEDPKDGGQEDVL